MSTLADVEFIRSNYSSDSALVVVDSSMRDRASYPTPSEYSVTLAEPFQLVHGIDILDATIPNAQYTVDDANNTLCVTTFEFAADDASVDVAVANMLDLASPAAVPAALAGTGDGTSRRFLLHALYAELARMTSFVQAYGASTAAESRRTFFLAGPNNPYEGMTADEVVARGVAFDAPETTVAMFRQTFDVPAGFLSTAPPAGIHGSFEHGGVTYYYLKSADEALQVYVGRNVRNSLDEFFQSQATSVGTITSTYSFAMYPRPSGGWRFVYYKELPCLTDGAFSVAARSYVLRLQHGIYDFQTLRTSVLQSTQAVPGLATFRMLTNEFTYRYAFEMGVPFALDMQKSTCGLLLGFDVNAVAGDSRSYRAIPFGTNLRFFGDTDGAAFAAGSSYNAYTLRTLYYVDPSLPSEMLLDVHVIEAPGMANLRGKPYVILRCDEIEHSVHRESPVGKRGIGMFKFDTLNDLTHLRFDFVNFVRKPFHPIARLARLTFRFEAPTGELFDFKGNNHVMVLAIKYHVPKGPAEFRGYTLNPNYTPDFQRYLMDNARGAGGGGHWCDDGNESDSSGSSGPYPGLDEYVRTNRRFLTDADARRADRGRAS